MKARSQTEMQENARPKYREHYRMVEQLTAHQGGRLLKFQLDDGWEPLCSFLGRPVPRVGFPRVDESAALEEQIRGIVWRGFVSALRSVATVVVPIAVLALRWWIVGG